MDNEVVDLDNETFSIIGIVVKKEEIPKTSKKQITAPSKRWGHTANLHKGFQYIFGGNTTNAHQYAAQAIFKLDLLNWHTNDWDKLLPSNIEQPLPRDSHISIVLSDKLYVIGGSIQGTKTNEVWIFDLKKHTWNELQPKGDTFIAREAHIGFVYKEKYIFSIGGILDNDAETKEEEKFQDVALQDTKHNVWKILGREDMIGDYPIRRESHSSTYCKGHYWIYGGQVYDNAIDDVKMLDDLYKVSVIDAHEKCQIVLSPDNSVRFKLKWEKILPKGGLIPLNSHAMTSMYDDFIFFVAGEGLLTSNFPESEPQILNKISVYSISKNLMSELKIENSALFKPRCALSVVAHDRSLFIFGGLESNETFNNEFIKIDIQFDKQQTLQILKHEYGIENNSRCAQCKNSYAEPFKPNIQTQKENEISETSSDNDDSCKIINEIGIDQMEINEKDTVEEFMFNLKIRFKLLIEMSLILKWKLRGFLDICDLLLNFQETSNVQIITEYSTKVDLSFNNSMLIENNLPETLEKPNSIETSQPSLNDSSKTSSIVIIKENDNNNKECSIAMAKSHKTKSSQILETEQRINYLNDLKEIYNNRETIEKSNDYLKNQMDSMHGCINTEIPMPKNELSGENSSSNAGDSVTSGEAKKTLEQNFNDVTNKIWVSSYAELTKTKKILHDRTSIIIKTNIQQLSIENIKAEYSFLQKATDTSISSTNQCEDSDDSFSNQDYDEKCDSDYNELNDETRIIEKLIMYCLRLSDRFIILTKLTDKIMVFYVKTKVESSSLNLVFEEIQLFRLYINKSKNILYAKTQEEKKHFKLFQLSMTNKTSNEYNMQANDQNPENSGNYLDETYHNIMKDMLSEECQSINESKIYLLNLKDSTLGRSEIININGSLFESNLEYENNRPEFLKNNYTLEDVFSVLYLPMIDKGDHSNIMNQNKGPLAKKSPMKLKQELEISKNDPHNNKLNNLITRIREQKCIKFNKSNVVHKNVIDMIIEIGKLQNKDIFAKVQDKFGVIKFGVLIKPKELRKLFNYQSKNPASKDENTLINYMTNEIGNFLRRINGILIYSNGKLVAIRRPKGRAIFKEFFNQGKNEKVVNIQFGVCSIENFGVGQMNLDLSDNIESIIDEAVEAALVSNN